MKTIEQQIELFKNNRFFCNEEQYYESMSEFDEIFNSKDIEKLYPLLYLIDDDSEHSEITQVFVDGIMSFYDLNKNRFVEIIIENIDLLHQNAKEWLEIIVINITNNNESKELVLNNLKRLPKENLQKFKDVYYKISIAHPVCKYNKIYNLLDVV
ncbi:MAG: Imm30 family immunity protein [Spirosomaceae bacterium]|nr:Imm30 family immunity protein [Spirosomataceae bacterium]